MKTGCGKQHARAFVALGVAAVVALAVVSSAMAQRPLGIDVSAWQGYVSQANWNSAYASGRVFAFIRVTHYYVPGVETDSRGDPDWYYSCLLYTSPSPRDS